MTVPLPNNLTGTSCFRVLASALQRYRASRAVHASARKYNQLFPRICPSFSRTVRDQQRVRETSAVRPRVPQTSYVWTGPSLPDLAPTNQPTPLDSDFVDLTLHL